MTTPGGLTAAYRSQQRNEREAKAKRSKAPPKPRPLSRRTLVENAVDAMAAELVRLPDDHARAAAFLMLASEVLGSMVDVSDPYTTLLQHGTDPETSR